MKVMITVIDVVDIVLRLANILYPVITTISEAAEEEGGNSEESSS
jgi:hypothetical protein